MKFYFRSSTHPNSQTDEKPCCPIKTISSKHANSIHKPPHSKFPPPKPPCPGHKPLSKKKKINFKALKKDTINSLNEVEHFLCNFQNIYKYIKLYKILK